MDIEKNVVKKTNKYVYLSNGTHMSHSDFHRYKQGIRNELAIVHQKEYAESIYVVVQSLKEREELKLALEVLEDQKADLKMAIDMGRVTDWEKYYRDEMKKHDDTKDKLVKHARSLYSDLASLPILQNFQESKGIKFIIQQNYETNEYRFCFDPYQLGANFHSTLSDFYRENKWGTVNGGWFKVINNKVILYAQSGDYGVYEDDIAIIAAKKIFPNKTIQSFAGKSWSELPIPENELPF